MENYLLTLVLDPGLDGKQQERVLEAVKTRFVGSEGKVKKEDKWGNREFAYPINKQTKGYYVHFEVETDPKLAKGLDKFLQLEEDILRYLLIRV